MQGCPHPPTPNPHQTLRARAATAAQLAASAVGPTAGAVRQPRSSPRKAGVQNLGCAPVRTTFRGELARHRARRSAGSPRTRPRSRASTRNSGRHAYEVFEASCGCHLYFDLDGRSAGSMPCGILPTAPPRRRRACCASTFLDSQSQFSFLVSQWRRHFGCFLISVCRLPIEAGIHHNNS